MTSQPYVFSKKTNKNKHIHVTHLHAHVISVLGKDVHLDGFNSVKQMNRREYTSIHYTIIIFRVSLTCLSYFSLQLMHNGWGNPPAKKHFPVGISAQNLRRTKI